MNNGRNDNRNGRPMPGQHRPVDSRTVQGQRPMPGQRRPADPRMAQRQRPVQGQGRPADPRMAQGQRPMPGQGRPVDPRAAQGQRTVPNGTQNRSSQPQVSAEYATNFSGTGRTRSLASTRRKATREQMREDNKRRRREALSLFFGRLAVYAVMLLVIGGIVAGGFFLYFYSTSDKSDTQVTYLEVFDGNAKKPTPSKVPGDVAYRDGKLYVNFTSIANGCGMSVVADSESVKFVLPDRGDTSDSAGTGHEEYVTFTDGTIDCTICGQAMRLSSPAVFVDKNVWVPADFVTNYVNGIKITAEDGKNTVYVERIVEEAATKDKEAVLAEVSFRLKAETAPDKVEVEEDIPTTGGMPEVTFTSDLSEYEMYMNPENVSEYLILVNKTNSLDADYVPSDLVNIANTRQDGRATQKMRMTAAKALDAMFIEMKAAGFTDVSVTSAYRSYEYQGQLYNNYVASSGREAADTVSAQAGKSEHQTGLCADLHNMPSASNAFANEAAYKWLSENAWKFGFILRFPEDKTDITGYMYESWHYRFVGRNTAWQIYDAGICLEEYLANK